MTAALALYAFGVTLLAVGLAHALWRRGAGLHEAKRRLAQTTPHQRAAETRAKNRIARNMKHCAALRASIESKPNG